MVPTDFGSPRTIFHQIMGHGSHAWKNLDPGVGARFRRMNHKLDVKLFGKFGAGLGVVEQGLLINH